MNANPPEMVNLLPKAIPVALFVEEIPEDAPEAIDDELVPELVAIADESPDDELPLAPGGGGLGSDGSSGALYTASLVGNSPVVERRGPSSAPAVPLYYRGSCGKT